LKPLFIANPYARGLTFPDNRTRLRRDHVKYLTLIRSIALLHQYQRQTKTTQNVEYVEVTREDIAVADKLMAELFAPSLDELPPQTRKLLTLIEALVNGRTDFFFSRRDVRAHIGWGMTQARVHLDRLVEMEYLIVHHGGRGQNYVYVLDLAASRSQLAGSKRPHGGQLAGDGGAHETRMNIAPNGVLIENREKPTSEARANGQP